MIVTTKIIAMSNHCINVECYSACISGLTKILVIIGVAFLPRGHRPFQLLVRLHQLVEFLQPLFQCQIRQLFHLNRVRQPVHRFPATEVEVAVAFPQTFIPPSVTELIVNHLPG